MVDSPLFQFSCIVALNYSFPSQGWGWREYSGFRINSEIGQDAKYAYAILYSVNS